MKYGVLALACLITGLGTVLLYSRSQANMTRAANMSQAQKEKMTNKLMEMEDLLKLTPDQTEKAEPIVLNQFRQMKEVRDKYGDPKTASLRTKIKMMREIDSIDEKTDAQLTHILTPDQMNQLHVLRQQKRDKMREASR